jgi:imidazoleglycerol-phosphate dehydratase
MLEQLSRHSLIDITLKVDGDLHIDQHHTTEDSALALGQAVAKALGEKRGITRYRHALIADGRDAEPSRDRHFGPAVPRLEIRLQPEKLGELDTELIEHWFHSFAASVGLTLHIETLYGATTITSAKHLQGARARAAPGGRDRSAQGRCDPLDQGHGVAPRASGV